MNLINDGPHTKLTHFISKIENIDEKKDVYRLITLFEQASNYEAKMWGPNMIGFGSYIYVHDNFEREVPLVAFSLKRKKIHLYLAVSKYWKSKELQHLGKCRRGKQCIFIDCVDDINELFLQRAIKESIDYLKTHY